MTTPEPFPIHEGDACPALPLRDFLTREEERFIDFLIDQAFLLLTKEAK